VGNNTVNAYSDPAIAFNYDGVYIGRPSSTSGMFYDLARVEVLKGPQGTLYGRNATGGAINVIPNRPKLNSTGGEVSAGYGNYNWLTLQGAVNLPWARTWRSAPRAISPATMPFSAMAPGTSGKPAPGFRSMRSRARRSMCGWRSTMPTRAAPARQAITSAR
jgi:outer membrane cobalamin receptor